MSYGARGSRMYRKYVVETLPGNCFGRADTPQASALHVRELCGMRDALAIHMELIVTLLVTLLEECALCSLWAGTCAVSGLAVSTIPLGRPPLRGWMAGPIGSTRDRCGDALHICVRSA